MFYQTLALLLSLKNQVILQLQGNYSSNKQLSLGKDSVSEKTGGPADMVTVDLSGPEQRTQSNYAQTPDPQKLGDNKWALF